MKKFKIILFLFSFVLSASSFAKKKGEVFYTVVEGDQLGTILYSLGSIGLWGPKGSVTKFVNSGKPDAMVLEPGDKVFIEAQIIKYECNIQFIGTREFIILRKMRKTKQKEHYLKTSHDKCLDFRMISSIFKDEDEDEDKDKIEIEEESKVEVQRKGRKSRITFVPRIGYGKIDLVQKNNGATGRAISKLNTGGKLSWAQLWNERLETSLIFDVEKKQFEKVNNRTVTGLGHTLYNFGIGGKLNLLRWLALESEITYGNDIIARVPSTTSMTIDRGSNYKFKGGTEITFADLNPFKIGMNAGAILKTGVDTGTYKSDLGWGGDSSIFIEQQFSDGVTGRGGLGYLYEKRNTDLVRETFTEMIFFFGVGVNFGSEDKKSSKEEGQH